MWCGSIGRFCWATSWNGHWDEWRFLDRLAFFISFKAKLRVETRSLCSTWAEKAGVAGRYAWKGVPPVVVRGWTHRHPRVQGSSNVPGTPNNQTEMDVSPLNHFLCKGFQLPYSRCCLVRCLWRISCSSKGSNCPSFRFQGVPERQTSGTG